MVFSGDAPLTKELSFDQKLMSWQRSFTSSRQAAAVVATATTAVLLLQLAALVLCSFCNPICPLQ
jgi:hypothetical protein